MEQLGLSSEGRKNTRDEYYPGIHSRGGGAFRKILKGTWGSVNLFLLWWKENTEENRANDLEKESAGSLIL